MGHFEHTLVWPEGRSAGLRVVKDAKKSFSF